VQWVIRRGKIYIEAHPPEDVALHGILIGAPCTCGDLKKKLIESERKRGIPRLKQKVPPHEPTFWQPSKDKKERRKQAKQHLPRASMPELVRYLVPLYESEYWVRTIRKAGLATQFCRPELGEGVAYSVSIYGATRPYMLRALVIARANNDGTVGARIAFIEAQRSGAPPTWKEIPANQVSVVDFVQARMSLPEVESLKRFAQQEAQTPTKVPW
jgi:hypothetical protein